MKFMLITVTYAGYEEECVHYHGLGSTDEVQQYIVFDNLLPRSLRYIMIYRYWTIG